MNLFGFIKGILIRDENDKTKTLSLEIDSSSTTNTRTTLKSAQTANRTIVLPNASTTLVGTNTTDVLTGKTIDADLNTITNIDNNEIKALAGIDATKIANGSVSNTEYQYLDGVTSNIQTQLDAGSSGLAAHIADASDAHDASAISNIPAGSIASTDVQSAINELDSDSVANAAGLAAHLVDAVDAHDASAISNVPLGNLSATDVQSALNELQTDIDASVSGANNTLSNLVNPTAINQDLLTNSSTRNIGSVGTNWNNIYAGSFRNADLRVEGSTTPSGVAVKGALIGDNGSVAVIASTGGSTNNAYIETANTAGTTGQVIIRSGNSSATNSGDVTLRTGTAAGTRGSIQLNGLNVNVNSTKIINVTDPTLAQDAATKAYADQFTLKSILTTKGDIFAATAPSTPARLGVGTNGQLLSADSSQATGLIWTSAGTGDFKADGSVPMTGAFLAESTYSVTAPEISKSGDPNTGIGFPAADTISQITAGVERSRIDSTGAQSSVIPGGSTLLPEFKCRAWVNFDGTGTAADLSGTYSRTGTTVTVTVTAHGYVTGNEVFADFTTGAATDGAFVVTSTPDANTLVFTHGTSGSTSGNVTLKMNTILASGNITRITDRGVGSYTVNFNTLMPDTNYAANVSSYRQSNGSNTTIPELDNTSGPTTGYIRVQKLGSGPGGGGGTDPTFFSVVIFR